MVQQAPWGRQGLEEQGTLAVHELPSAQLPATTLVQTPDGLQHEPMALALAHGPEVHEPPKYEPCWVAHPDGVDWMQVVPRQHAPDWSQAAQVCPSRNVPPACWQVERDVPGMHCPVVGTQQAPTLD